MPAYTIFKSNGTDAVFVPDASTGTGINNVSTSLKLVGRGYANYGQAFAENFLHLLENFASPRRPANPTEGQLWYQTEVGGDTNINNLMVFDGINWVSATGYYHQSGDPTLDNLDPNYITDGDMWFGTGDNVLRVRNNGQWITIGPSISGEAKTGTEAYTFTDSANPSLQYNVVLNWADGSVVSVFSSAPAFLPNTYPLGMDGFDIINPGITVKKTDSQLGRIIAKADDSFRLEGIAASSYLRKDDSTNVGQRITGKVVFETPNAAAPENRDGLIVRVAGTSPVDYLQVYQTRPSDRNPGAAIFANNSPGGKIILRTNTNNNLTDVITVDGTSTHFAGTVLLDQKLNSFSTQTGALIVKGGIGLSGNLYVGGLIVDYLGRVIGSGSAGTTSTFTISNLTASTSTNTGALVVTGGAGIAGNVNIGNTATIHSTSTSISTTTGALIVKGGVGIAGDLFVGGKIVAQELDVQLTTVTTTLIVTDDIISTYNTSTSTSTTTGALVIAGGVGIGGNINVGGSGRFTGLTAFNVTATLLTISGQSTVAGLTATNVTATTVTVTSDINVGGYGKFTGTFDENTATVGVYVGVAGSPPASPRIVFAAGTGTNWQVDNYSGSLRVFQSTGIALTISGSTATLNKDLTIGGVISQTVVAVGSLPSPGSAGMRAFVSDANTTTFYSDVIAGAPGFYVPVFHNGSNWKIG